MLSACSRGAANARSSAESQRVRAHSPAALAAIAVVAQRPVAGREDQPPGPERVLPWNVQPKRIVGLPGRELWTGRVNRWPKNDRDRRQQRRKSRVREWVRAHLDGEMKIIPLLVV